jgi:Cation efflux family
MAGHDHAHDRAAKHNQKQVFWAMLLTGGCMVAEAIGGVIAGSLALIADAGHMLTDTAALALAWAAFRVGHWPQDARRSYGYAAEASRSWANAAASAQDLPPETQPAAPLEPTTDGNARQLGWVRRLFSRSKPLARISRSE